MSDTIRLAIEMAPLPANFQGSPQQFAEAMVERIRVLFPTGQWTFVISDTEPSSNQGPWLKNGTQWYVWDEDLKQYVPLDISPSWQVAISETEPDEPGRTPIWLKYSGTRVIGMYLYLGGSWVGITTNRGTTAERPANPGEYEEYFDTDINVELLYYNGLWRTKSGSPGDVKFVTYATLSDALRYNPGWGLLSQALSDAGVNGRTLIAAHKDAGATPLATYPADSGITARAAREKVGLEYVALTVAQLPAHAHEAWTGAVRWLFGSAQTGSAGNHANVQGQTYGGVLQRFFTQNTGSGESHGNMQPSLALWCLSKL